MRLTPRVAGFPSEYPAGFKLECMAGFVGTRSERAATSNPCHLPPSGLVFSGGRCRTVPSKDAPAALLESRARGGGRLFERDRPSSRRLIGIESGVLNLQADLQ
jgi:hypothetical protein